MLYGIGLLITTIFMSGCQTSESSSDGQEAEKRMSVWMAESEMTRFPQLWKVDSVRIPFWGYTHGVIAKAMLDMYEYTGDEKYYEYVRDYVDTLVYEDGYIETYDSTKYNIDMINPGKILFPFYEMTGKEKYKEAATTLVAAMKDHPKTSEGGFWHKKVYPHQMWLDGLYMGSPFLTEYAATFDKPELFDVVAKQVELIDKYTYDPEAGLHYHGWDESKSMNWANPETGTSPNFWGRSVGWFAMALVDVLDHFPEDHSDREMIIAVLNKVASGIQKHQDEKSGVWYQVLDQGDREGNYLEATASTMFVYVLYKAIRKGYIPDTYLQTADKGYQGILDEFIRENSDGTISLMRCCAVAGLGGKRQRDGSFEYYVNEKIRPNDPKGVGPFIWASMEYETLNQKRNNR